MKRYSLILAVVVVAAPFAHAGEDSVKQTIAYVQKLQTESGAFRADAKKTDPSLRATSSALRALKYFGGELRNKEGAIKFVESCWDGDAGGFSDTPKGKADVFSTAVGLMAVVELKMSVDKYAVGASNYLSENAKKFEEIRIAAAGFEAIKRRAPKAKQWATEISAPIGDEPGVERASYEVTMMRLGSMPKQNDDFASRTIKLLNAGQRQNGGWGKADSEIASDLETTYRVMRCYHMLKAKPGNVEGVRSFVAKCRNADGGYAVAPGQASSVGGTYFASIILHWLKE